MIDALQVGREVVWGARRPDDGGIDARKKTIERRQLERDQARRLEMARERKRLSDSLASLVSEAQQMKAKRSPLEQNVRRREEVSFFFFSKLNGHDEATDALAGSQDD